MNVVVGRFPMGGNGKAILMRPSPHPTLTESLHEAALAALGMPIHAVK